ncbi:Smr/MutS family protein [Celeribacter marinus]|uniref:Smr/MutS family protein n=1 Tax=Celeribacter marinus TaxID=1397108 RepID=A0A0P0AAC3_9RHOB|nr:Smr/MutS family protein [Celeribacter marinus]ALI55710.1 Smr/MutS family protein [Celeribacter marinus]SFL04118.1 DNA-nicking endonuclease, Smr domain [Celeribacter marinus]
MRRRVKGKLSDDDRDVWNEVKKTATPMMRAEFVVSRDLSAKSPKKTPPKSLDAMITQFEVGARSARTPMGHNLAPSVSQRLAHAPVEMDRKKFGKMKKGKLKPEARLDLHGMTLAHAHPALQGFILSSAAAGRRLVLVITGKGKDRDDGGPIPIRRGVLKNQVPHWLHQAPLRSVVMQVNEAHLTHGGSGAYYVYLRRNR